VCGCRPGRSSRHGTTALVDAVRRAAAGVDPDGLMVDAYGGVGLFATTVSPLAPVVLVESSWSSCADAQVNLADRAAEIEEMQVEDWTPRPAALVVADPSRSGLGREATDVLAACEAPVLVLVSCDPVSLARDARLLADRGYAHAGSEVIDLFPHTSHVEVVTRFELS
jgi:23S rRNA (uracil1939-C5)-methyltransferase